MMTPRTCFEYDVVSTLFPTPGLITTREVLFITGGVQTDFIAEQSTELTSEMVFPNMLKVKNIIFYDIVVDVPDYSTTTSTQDPEPKSLDEPTQHSMPYHHPRHIN